VGRTRQRLFDGINFQPEKLPENAHAFPTGCSPTITTPAFFAGDRVHGVLGGASLDGNIVFLVTQDDSKVVLFYDPLIFGNPAYIALQP
jgi:hypothetical protein